MFIYTFLVLIPLLALLAFIVRGEVISNESQTVAMIFVLLVVLGSSLHRIIRNALVYKYGNNIGGVFSILILIAGSFLYAATVLYVTTNSNVKGNYDTLIKTLIFPFLALLVLAWVYIHSIAFTRQPTEVQSLRTKIMEMDNPSLAVQAILNKHPNMLDNQNQGFLSKYGHVLASVSILLAILSVEIGLLTIISQKDSKDYSDQVYYMAIFYVAAVPLFIFLGTVFSSSKLKKDDKYCTVLLFLTLIPAMGVMFISYELYKNSNTYYFGILIGVGFPSVMIYWLSMSTIYEYNKRIYQFLSSICCLVVIVPLGLMWPLYSANGMKKTTFYVCTGVLFFGGILVFGVWFIQIVLKLKKESRMTVLRSF